MFTADFSVGVVLPLWSQIDQPDLFFWLRRCEEGMKSVSIVKNMVLQRNLV